MANAPPRREADPHAALSCPEIIPALTDDDRGEFAELDAFVSRWLRDTFQVGRALARIRDGRLYRDEFETFEDYVAKRHAISRSYAHRSIEAAFVVDDLLPIGNTVPTNEAQCRPLAKLADADRQECWQSVVAHAEQTGEPITAKLVKSFADEYRAPKPDAPEPGFDDETFDEIGACWELLRIVRETLDRWPEEHREAARVPLEKVMKEYGLWT